MSKIKGDLLGAEIYISRDRIFQRFEIGKKLRHILPLNFLKTLLESLGIEPWLAIFVVFLLQSRFVQIFKN